MDSQCPDGLLSDAEECGGARHHEDEDAEEDVNGQVGGSEVRRESGEQEGDEPGQPLKWSSR